MERGVTGAKRVLEPKIRAYFWETQEQYMARLTGKFSSTFGVEKIIFKKESRLN